MRPTTGYAPAAVVYGQTFRIQTPDAADIARATWVRLSSVTHSFNMNQRFVELSPQYVAYSGGPSHLKMTAPTSSADCPPPSGQAFIDCPLSPTRPTMEVQVEAPRSCVGAAVTASLSMTGYFPSCSGSGQPSYRASGRGRATFASPCSVASGR